MSDIKDIQRTNSLSSFLDTHSIRTTPFLKNTSGERAYARAERIVAALFLLTNHFSSSEQLRVSLRKNGTMLLSSILSLRTGLRSSGADVVESALAVIRELISLVRMSAIAGYISIQNAEEVVQALDELGALLVVSQRSNLSETIILTRDDLMPSIPISETAVIKKTPNKGHVIEKDKVVEKQNTDTQKTKTDMVAHRIRPNIRSQEVLEILRVRGRLGIKDIYSNMPGCSEKMVQRELTALVSKGQILKIGEKRWSVYELVQ